MKTRFWYLALAVAMSNLVANAGGGGRRFLEPTPAEVGGFVADQVADSLENLAKKIVSNPDRDRSDDEALDRVLQLRKLVYQNPIARFIDMRMIPEIRVSKDDAATLKALEARYVKILKIATGIEAGGEDTTGPAGELLLPYSPFVDSRLTKHEILIQKGHTKRERYQKYKRAHAAPATVKTEDAARSLARLTAWYLTVNPETETAKDGTVLETGSLEKLREDIDLALGEMEAPDAIYGGFLHRLYIASMEVWTLRAGERPQPMIPGIAQSRNGSAAGHLYEELVWKSEHWSIFDHHYLRIQAEELAEKAPEVPAAGWKDLLKRELAARFERAARIARAVEQALEGGRDNARMTEHLIRQLDTKEFSKKLLLELEGEMLLPRAEIRMERYTKRSFISGKYSNSILDQVRRSGKLNIDELLRRIRESVPDSKGTSKDIDLPLEVDETYDELFQRDR